MENESKTEGIRKNVIRIAWVIIVIQAIGMYKVMNEGERFNFTSYSHGGGLAGVFGYPFLFNIVVFISMIMGIALIYFSALTLQFNEKGRNVLSRLIIAEVVIVFAVFLFSGIYMFPFSISIGFLMVILRSIIYNGAMVVMYILFYRFLNKADTKAVFAEDSAVN